VKNKDKGIFRYPRFNPIIFYSSLSLIAIGSKFPSSTGENDVYEYNKDLDFHSKRRFLYTGYPDLSAVFIIVL
jgi:hypothetical protein